MNIQELTTRVERTNPLLAYTSSILKNLGIPYEVREAVLPNGGVVTFATTKTELHKLGSGLYNHATLLNIPVSCIVLGYRVSSTYIRSVDSKTAIDYISAQIGKIGPFLVSDQGLRNIPVLFTDLLEDKVQVVISPPSCQASYDSYFQEYKIKVFADIGIAVPHTIHHKLVVRCRGCPKRVKCMLQPQECNLYFLNRQAREGVSKK